jgi:dinuclear metal center YbgI/SA1388 family protein
MVQLSDLLTILEDIAPTRLAEAWDNVGLLVGDPLQTVHKALLAIDYTPAVAEEARNHDCDIIIAYHPPIFHPLKRLTAGSLIYDAIRRGVAIYSPHTALDVADGGTNDMLADAVGLIDRGPLRVTPAAPTHYKLIVFVPEDDVERVSRAMFDAGAGWIGDYSSCSFRTPGTGTFFGMEGAAPVVGDPGKLEQVPELRLETVLPIAHVDEVIRALIAAHAYEEPAFDLVQLAARPEGVGLGRIGPLPAVTTVEKLLPPIKQALEIDHLLVAGSLDKVVKTVAVCAGACGDLLDDAIARNVDLYLTGEIRHHDAIKATAAGLTVVCTLHSNSERAVLKRIARRLQERLPDLPTHISQSDRDPFTLR